MQLRWPLAAPRKITQRFGENPDWYTPYGLAGHEGMDLSCVTGTPVRAAHDGTVYCPPTSNTYGVYLYLTGGGVTTLYAHLSAYQVADGARVQAGQVIALSGNTGRSSGAHLHFGLKVAGVANAPFKGWLDPEPYLSDAVAPTSKLGLHFQRVPSWATSVVNSGIPWVKLIDPTGPNPYPNARTIGRLWIGGDHVEQAYIAQGAQGAERYFSELLPRYLAAPWVHCWEGPNEPAPYWSDLLNLEPFSVRWIELMHGEGLRTVAGNLSCGQPPENHIKALADALALTDYLGLHEYARANMRYGEGWLCLRYRKTLAELRALGIRVPPVLITECGVDGGAVLPEDEAKKETGKGWKSYTTREGYQAQLAWYDSEISKDADVVAATPFVAGPNEDWRDFEIDEQLARWVAARHTQQAGGEPMIELGALREAVWNAGGIPYNPDAALPRYAREHQLGAPLTGEVDVAGFRAQGYTLGIAYCRIGDWAHIQHIAW